MIDLANGLPNAVLVGDEYREVDTSFRTWLRFGDHVGIGLWWGGVFVDGTPDGDWFGAAMEFYLSPTNLPRPSEDGGARVIDFHEDGDLIVAAFQQAYGIDLTSEDMHWHRFKALLHGLPDDTRLSQVMSIRAWRKQSGKRDHDEEMARRQRAWALPDPEAEAEEAAVLEWAERFFRQE